MASKKPLITVNMTASQIEAVKLAQIKSGLKAAEFRRLAFKMVCKAYNVDYPEDMPQHGGSRK